MRKPSAIAGAVTLAFALLVALGLSGASASHPAAAPMKAALAAQARAAFNHYVSAHAPVIKSGPARLVNGSISTLTSVNWSGFADAETGTDKVTGVSGSWVMPAVTCLPSPYQNQDAFLVNWVGIDGVTDSTVEQLGTGAQCFEGVTYYYVWYEMYPGGTVQEGTTECINDNVDCPKPGDHISASVTVSHGGKSVNNYALTLTDHTTAGNNFSVTQPCPANTCLDSSGEWIVERPAYPVSFGTQILPLADYQVTAFTQGRITSHNRLTNIQGFNGYVYNVQMTDDTDSYYLDCVGQTGPSSQLLLVSNASACPTVAPTQGSGFSATFDSSY